MDERERPDDDRGILDTVRRILSEDQARSSEPRRREGEADEDVLELDPAMMVGQPSPGRAADEADAGLVSGRAEQTSRQSVGSLRSALREQRTLLSHRNGPSIEEIIREEIRPLLREWLDSHLPEMVERVVRVEIARIVERDGA